MMSLENDQRKCEIGNPSAVVSSFSNWRVKGFLSQLVALKVDFLKDRKIYCLQVRPYMFQPGYFTGLGSEGVKRETLELVPCASSSMKPRCEIPSKQS